MDHPDYQKNLAMAGIASMGGRRQGANVVKRSRRQRQRAFEEEMGEVVAAFKRTHPDVVLPTDPDEWEARRAASPDFHAWCKIVDGLAAKWMV
jgi:hypothetical protein